MCRIRISGAGNWLRAARRLTYAEVAAITAET